MRPTLINESGRDIPPISYQKIISATMNALEVDELEPLSIVYVSLKRGEDLNREYRSKDAATNVLSFAETRDIVITPAVVEREADEQGISFVYWLTYLVIHGVLHLEGYTHTTDEDEKRMQGLEERIIQEVGVSR